MRVIGLTGGVASGKSILANMLKEKGAIVIDADRIAREQSASRNPVYEAIVDHFGKSILNSKGEIDRRELGRIVFSDRNKLSLLNDLTHGPVIKEIQGLLEKLKREKNKGVVLVEIPLLIESGVGPEFDKIIVITASDSKRMERLAAKGFSEKEAKNRIRSQIPDAARQAFADYIIENDGSLEELEAKAEDLWQALAGQV